MKSKTQQMSKCSIAGGTDWCRVVIIIPKTSIKNASCFSMLMRCAVNAFYSIHRRNMALCHHAVTCLRGQGSDQAGVIFFGN